MATEIILARHGETLWNQESRFQGFADIKLSSSGKKQAQRLADRFADKELDIIYASDLKRAVMTAKRVAEYHEVEINQLPALREADFGDWEGMTFDQIKKQNEEKLNAWLEDPVEVKTPGGEKFEEVQIRASEALEQIKEEHEEEKILVVAHGGTIRALLANLLEMPLNNFWRIQQDNTAVNIINFYEEDPIVSLLNCTQHLSEND